MAAAAKLYSIEVLTLATSLAQFPLRDDLPLRGQARSPACGSVLELGLECDAEGRITRIGLRAQACAIGQASAAIFAQAAKGCNADRIAEVLTEMQRWLAGEAAMPDWPGLAVIAPARDYPGRHGAMLLAWKAAHEALSSVPKQG